MRYTSLVFASLLSFSALAENTYIVRPGDTVLKISDRLIRNQSGPKNPRRFEMSRQLMKLNPQLKDSNQLTVGEAIRLPEGIETEASAKTHAAEPAPSPAPVQAVVTPQPPEPVAPTVVTAPVESPAVIAPQVDHEVTTEHHDGGGHHAASFFMVQPRYQINEYEVKNETTGEHLKAHSKIVAGLGLAYGIPVGTKTHFVMKAGANYTQLDKFNSAANSLGNKLRWVKNFGVGIEHHWLSALKVEVMALYADHLFIVPDGANVYKVANVSMPGAELVLDWAFWRGSSYALGLTAAAEYIGSGDQDGVKYESAIEPVGSLYWQSARGEQKLNYRLAAVYTMSHQSPEKDTGVEQHMTSLGFNLSLMFPL